MEKSPLERSIYQVPKGGEFVLQFRASSNSQLSSEELKHRFLNFYSPDTGFSIFYDARKREEFRFVLFTEADRFETKLYDSKDSICLYVLSASQITQGNTLNENVRSIRVLGLTEEYFCRAGFGDEKGETQPARASDGRGLRKLLEYVRTGSSELADPAESRKAAWQIRQLDEHRRIIEAKKKYEEEAGQLLSAEFESCEALSREKEGRQPDDILFRFRIANPDEIDPNKVSEGMEVSVSSADRSVFVRGSVIGWREPFLLIIISGAADQLALVTGKGTIREISKKVFRADYSRFDAVRQSASDGTIYRFCLVHPEQVSPENASVGTGVNIDVNDDGNRIRGTIQGYEPPYLTVKFNTQEDVLSRLAKSGAIQESPNPEYRYKLNAIRRLKAGTSVSTHLLDILFSHELLPLEDSIAYEPPKDAGPIMNDMQKLAVRKALNSEDFLLVQGPPGTGKTTIITEMIRCFVLQGKRVLICSKNNLAVDNVMEKCKDLYYDDQKTKKMQCVRLGNEERVLDSVRTLLPAQLTGGLQKKVQEASSRQKSEYYQWISRRREQFEAARENLRDLCTVLQKLYQEAVLIRGMEEKSRGLSGFLLLSMGKGRTLRHLLQDMDEKMNASMAAAAVLAGLSGPSSREQQQFIRCQKELVSCGKDLLDALEAVPGRSRLLFRDEAEELKKNLAAAFSAESRIQDVAIQYRGNPAAGMLASLKVPADFSVDMGSRLQEEMDSELDALRRRTEELGRILREWEKELENPKLGLEEALLHSVKIVGATCMGINSSSYFGESEFDVAIVDEAGQITLHDLLVPLEKAKKVILIGDHMQLPPMGESDFCEYARKNGLLGYKRSEQSEEDGGEYDEYLHAVFERSLFEELYRAKDVRAENKVMLDTQFRMHPAIAAFISKQFYEDRYTSAPDMTAKRTLKIGRFNKPMYFVDTQFAKNHGETEKKDAQGNSGGYYNAREAEIISAITVYLIHYIHENNYEMPRKKPGDNPLMGKDNTFDIGIITAYKAQKREIKNRIAQKLRDLAMAPGALITAGEADAIAEHLSVDTLDSFQGRDNQIILYSFVRSNPDHRIGFLQEVRRLNVMMTRAKSLLIMVGDAATLKGSSAPSIHNPEKKASDYYRALTDYCRDSADAELISIERDAAERGEKSHDEFL